MCTAPSLWGIVVAAGDGARFGARKQFELLAGRRVVERACDVFPSDTVAGVVVALPPDDVPALDLPGHAVAVTGGPSRRASVSAALARIPSTAELVAVHDAARCLAAPALLYALLRGLQTDPDAAGAIPVVAIGDAIKRRVGGALRAVDRADLVAAQTPQLFRADALRTAHIAAPADTPAWDDAELVELAGGRVIGVEGDVRNRKLTHPGDVAWFAAQVAV